MEYSKRGGDYRLGSLAVRLNDLRAAIIIGSELTANIRALKRFQLCVLYEPYPLYSDYAFKRILALRVAPLLFVTYPHKFKIYASKARRTQIFVSARPLKF